jgi:outer membrane protein OmpA-like peptidoglycan-associated protein
MNLFYRFFILIFLLISGCANRQPCTPLAPISIAVQRQNLIDNLQKAGVQIIRLGDELRLILSNQRFFVKSSPRLQVTSYRHLDDIVRLLNLDKNYGINVLAYTPSLANPKLNTGLAQQQAQAVVDYLLQQGLNTRLIAASAWQGQRQQKLGGFSNEPPRIFSIEIRARLLQPEDSQ